MKKLLSIILALALVLSLAACGGAGMGGADNNLTEEKLKGTWCLELDITAMSEIVGDSLGATMGMGDITPYLDAIPDDLALTVYMVFDGDYVMIYQRNPGLPNNEEKPEPIKMEVTSFYGENVSSMELFYEK